MPKGMGGLGDLLGQRPSGPPPEMMPPPAPGRAVGPPPSIRPTGGNMGFGKGPTGKPARPVGPPPALKPAGPPKPPPVKAAPPSRGKAKAGVRMFGSNKGRMKKGK